MGSNEQKEEFQKWLALQNLQVSTSGYLNSAISFANEFDERSDKLSSQLYDLKRDFFFMNW